jgi:hypothetical protein
MHVEFPKKQVLQRSILVLVAQKAEKKIRKKLNYNLFLYWLGGNN